MKKLILFSFLLTLASCNGQSTSIRGVLDVRSPLELIVSEDTTDTIPVGTFDAKIRVRSKKEVVLKVNNIRFKFKSDENIIQSTTGIYQIPAEKLNQPYDMDILSERTVTKTETTSTFEHCTIFNPGNPPYVPPTHEFGRKVIYYHDIVTKIDLSLDMLTPEFNEVIANFEGTHTSYRKVVEFEGPCH